MTPCPRSIQTKYTSLAEATKFIPRFDGYNIEASLFIDVCEKACRLINPTDIPRLRDIIISKLVGESALCIMEINSSINGILYEIKRKYLNRQMPDLILYHPDVLQELIKVNIRSECQRCITKNSLNQILSSCFANFCCYCRSITHSEENHCCQLLGTNKMFKMLEHNRLSRHIFLNRLYMRELGVSVATAWSRYFTYYLPI